MSFNVGVSDLIYCMITPVSCVYICLRMSRHLALSLDGCRRPLALFSPELSADATAIVVGDMSPNSTVCFDKAVGLINPVVIILLIIMIWR